jgi:hypothetical protein
MKGPTEPPRLSADVPPESTLGRALGAAQRRGPTDEQWRALERSVFTAIAPGATASASTSGAARASGSAPAPAGAVKLIALLALASMGTGAGVRWLRRPAAAVAVVETRSMTSVSAGVSQPVRSPPPPETPAFVDLRGPAAQEPKAPPARRRASARRPVETNEPAAPDELELLERADRALASAPAVALSLAESHARLFPKGAMEEEREVIAVSALARLGRDRDARARADRFMRAHAGSAYALRIQRALAQRGSAGDEVR